MQNPGAAEGPWFQNPEDLVTGLRSCRMGDAEAPRMRKYRDLQPIGRGGQGTVFLARRSRDDRPVAIKVFHRDRMRSPRTLRRLEREVELVSRLGHPRIVRLHQWGQLGDGRAFLAMEFVPGRPLDEALANMDMAERLGVFEEICGAVEHAHRRGVIHRDLKPGNVRVDPRGHVRLLDFGLAVADEAAGESDTSQRVGFTGSLPWASPEQVRGGTANVDTRADIYGLGVLLYQGVSGRFPFPTESGVGELIEGILNRAPAPFPRGAQRIPRDLETVILRCLAKEPERRYAEVGELRRDLDHVRRGEPIQARRDTAWFLLRRAIAKRPWSAAALGIGALALAVATGISALALSRARASEDRATASAESEAATAERVGLVNEYLLGSLLGLGGGPGAAATPVGTWIDTAAEGLDRDPSLVDRPDARADLHHAFAYWFAALPTGKDRAEVHVREALRLRESLPEVDPADLASARESLAWLRLEARDFEAALSIFEQARRDHLEAGSEELLLLRIDGHRASCMFALERYDGLEGILLDCLGVAERRFGAEDLQTQGIRDALAAIPGPLGVEGRHQVEQGR